MLYIIFLPQLQCCGVDSYTEWDSVLQPPRPYPGSCCSEASTCYNTPVSSSSVYTEVRSVASRWHNS